MYENIDWEDILEVIRMTRETSCQEVYIEIGDFTLDLRKTNEEETIQHEELTLPLVEVKSPIVGTFYEAKTSNTNAVIEVGTLVSNGDSLGTVKSIKESKTIKATCDGMVRRVTISNGSLVEYGQTIMLLQPTQF